jgi:hypothetical protein
LLYPKELSKSRSSELISNSTSVDASKNTCFKGHPETVLPSESTELQRKRRSRERIWELAAFQGAEVGLRMLQFLAISRDKIATESRSRQDGGGGSVRLPSINNAILSNSYVSSPIYAPKSTRDLMRDFSGQRRTPAMSSPHTSDACM